jgi:alkylated DNA repair dioxygenase AlkB
MEDGDCRLLESFVEGARGHRVMRELAAGVTWTQPEVTLFGRRIPSPRLSAWYGDSDAVYRYSGLVNEPRPWLPVLSRLRRRVEAGAGARFNSVLLNLYRDGDDAMGWHADDEPELGPLPVIASLSLGGVRRFRLKHRSRGLPAIGLDLPHGSLLVMAGATQRNWKHCVTRTRRVVEPRINLTFRQVRPLRDIRRRQAPGEQSLSIEGDSR